MSKYIPEFIKPIIRFFYYKNERKKVFREFQIKRLQNKRIRKEFSRNCRRLIVIFSTGADLNSGKENLSGGLMSIVSIFEETKRLKHIHNSEVIICTQPNEFLISKYTSFENSVFIYRPEQIFKYFSNLDYLLIHSICYSTPDLDIFFNKYKLKISQINHLKINILNQNIRLMPNPEKLSFLKEWTSDITQTTAHKSYSTKEIRNLYGFPLHYLSVKGGPELYNFKVLSNKKDLILFSPDDAVKNSEIKKIINDHLPHFETRTIKNLKYHEYLQLVEKAKYIITFGEGLDYYFIENVFMGGVSIAINNSLFFPSDFKDCNGLFYSYNDLKDQVVNFIQNTNNPNQFELTNRVQFNLCCSLYNNNKYIDNLRNYYLGNYTIK